MSVWKKVKIKDIAILDNGINFNKSAYACLLYTSDAADE